MITAVDTSVLLDVLLADTKLGPGSRDALRGALSQGRLVASDVVWAETAAAFPSSDAATAAMRELTIEYSATTPEAAADAGAAWRVYRASGGKRDRVIADFLIGAHAASHADRLLTRDRGFYRTYFRGLEMIDPSA